MQDRIIIHLDMDAFFAAVEERESPQFKGKPVVVGADPRGGRGRGVVSTANYEARKYGVHSAMPISKAYQLCPDAVFLPPNFALYEKVSKNIMGILQSHSMSYGTVFEQVSLDEAYIDVSFCKSYEQAKQLAQQIRKEIWEAEKLPCSCGIGPNKMIAKIACEDAKPDGATAVQAEDAEAYIADLNVQKIPGIGAKTAQILRSSGLQKVADLKRLSEHDMEDLFGSRASQMAKRVRGIDEEHLVAERPVKSIGKEVTFAKDTRDPELLIGTFERLSKEVAKEVREQGLYGTGVVAVCRLSGFETHTKSKKLPRPTQQEAVLRSAAMKLFLRFILEKQKPIRLIGVRVQIAFRPSL